MDKQELNQSIALCIDENSGIEIYIGLKNNGPIRRTNFSEATISSLRDAFITCIREKIIDCENNVINFSSADERNNVILKYDLEETESIRLLKSVIDANADLERFSFENDGISNIDYFLIVIGDVDHRIIIYKQLTSINIYKHNTGMFVRNRDNVFMQIEEDFVRIVPGVDFFMLNGNLYILNFGLKLFEKSFQIHNVIVSAAKKQIEQIETFGLVENVDRLINELHDISFARKLSNITETSPVLGQIENSRIITFTSNHPLLKKSINFSDDNTKIKLTSKKACRLFVKLLNDDFLNSDLTNIYYDSLAKDSISNNEDIA